MPQTPSMKLLSL